MSKKNYSTKKTTSNNTANNLGSNNNLVSSDSKTTNSSKETTAVKPQIPISNTQDDNKKNQFESNKIYFTICIYALFVIAIGAVIVYLIMNLNETKATIQRFFVAATPFIIAIFIAYILNPFVKKIDSFLLEKIFKLKRPLLRKILAILIAYLFVIGLIIIALFYILPQTFNSIRDLFDRLPGFYDEILVYIGNLDEKFPSISLDLVEQKLKEAFPELISYGTDLITNIFPMLYTVSISIVKGFINLILSIVISCYMLSDKKTLSITAKRIIYSIMPKEKANSFCETASECNKIFTGFIVGKSIDSLIIGIICFVLMSILRLPYAILLSIIVGLTNMIPYFGPFIGAVPGILIYLFINPIQALIFAVLIFVLQQFDGLYLGPKILGESTGLSPLWVIFAITIGGAYAGVLGMFLGVPTVAVISYLFSRIIEKRLDKKQIALNENGEPKP